MAARKKIPPEMGIRSLNVIENKPRKNDRNGPCHDVVEKTGTYGSLSAMLMINKVDRRNVRLGAYRTKRQAIPRASPGGSSPWSAFAKPASESPSDYGEWRSNFPKAFPSAGTARTRCARIV